MTWRPVYGPQALALTQQTYMLKPNVPYFLTQIIPLCVDSPLLAGTRFFGRCYRIFPLCYHSTNPVSQKVSGFPSIKFSFKNTRTKLKGYTQLLLIFLFYKFGSPNTKYLILYHGFLSDTSVCTYI